MQWNVKQKKNQKPPKKNKKKTNTINGKNLTKKKVVHNFSRLVICSLSRSLQLSWLGSPTKGLYMNAFSWWEKVGEIFIENNP